MPKYARKKDVAERKGTGQHFARAEPDDSRGAAGHHQSHAGRKDKLCKNQFLVHLQAATGLIVEASSSMVFL